MRTSRSLPGKQTFFSPSWPILFGQVFTSMEDSKEGARMHRDTISQLTERTLNQDPDFFSGKLPS
jgi:hypothetical protein